MAGSPTGFNGSQFVKEMVFTLNFPLVRDVLWVFTSMFFLNFPLFESDFLRFYFLCFKILLYILPDLPLRGLGFLKESDLC